MERRGHSSQPDRFFGAGGSAGDTRFGLRTNGKAPRRGQPGRKVGERAASPGGPETTERTAGCVRRSPSPIRVRVSLRHRHRDRSRRGRKRSGATEQAQTERQPGDSGSCHGAVRGRNQGAGRIRHCTPQYRRIRREDAVGGRQIRSPEKLTGASRKATRGSVAPGPPGAACPPSRGWQKIPSPAGGRGIYSASVTDARPSVCRP